MCTTFVYHRALTKVLISWVLPEFAVLLRAVGGEGGILTPVSVRPRALAHAVAPVAILIDRPQEPFLSTDSPHSAAKIIRQFLPDARRFEYENYYFRRDTNWTPSSVNPLTI